MTTVSLKAQVVGEAKLLSFLYPAAIALGVAASFVTHFTSLKIVTSSPPNLAAISSPLPLRTQEQRFTKPLPLEKTVWEFGFPEPLRIPATNEPSESVPVASLTMPATLPPFRPDQYDVLFRRASAFFAGSGEQYVVSLSASPSMTLFVDGSKSESYSFDSFAPCLIGSTACAQASSLGDKHVAGTSAWSWVDTSTWYGIKIKNRIGVDAKNVATLQILGAIYGTKSVGTGVLFGDSCTYQFADRVAAKDTKAVLMAANSPEAKATEQYLCTMFPARKTATVRY